MKLVTFEVGGASRPGLIEGDSVRDISAADPSLLKGMLDLLEAGEAGMKAIRDAARSAPCFPLESVRLTAPVMPRKLLALGINYQAHIAEMRARLPDFKFPSVQTWFNKQITSVTGPFEPIHRPRVSEMLDYEGELAVVIGKRCRHVASADAGSVIAGYTVCNDVSVRDWQIASPTTTMGKSFDTHAPLGPAIVTPDEVGDPQDLNVSVWVNDELRQEFSTADMIYSCAEQIEHLSKAFTLEPGDVILTGTSAGNGILRNPPAFLKVGDLVRVSIDRVGTIENRVVDEPDGFVFQR